MNSDQHSSLLIWIVVYESHIIAVEFIIIFGGHGILGALTTTHALKEDAHA